MKLNEWIETWKKKYSEREMNYMEVHKALIQIQFKDKETGEIHLDQIKFTAKDAEKLIIKSGQ